MPECKVQQFKPVDLGHFFRTHSGQIFIAEGRKGQKGNNMLETTRHVLKSSAKSRPHKHEGNFPAKHALHSPSLKMPEVAATRPAPFFPQTN
jgi:hypothetical protein